MSKHTPGPWAVQKCHPDCADYGEDCVCGPCERCDEDGMVDVYMGSDAGGYSYHDVPQTCPQCGGTKIDPEARA